MIRIKNILKVKRECYKHQINLNLLTLKVFVVKYISINYMRSDFGMNEALNKVKEILESEASLLVESK